MKDTQIDVRLKIVGIPIEPDFAVPVNGVSRKLPYMVVRKKSTIEGSDNGNVQYMATEWLVALFAANKDPSLERKISLALAGVGKVEVDSFPDGTPYQTNFEFKTRHILK